MRPIDTFFFRFNSPRVEPQGAKQMRESPEIAMVCGRTPRN